MEDGGQGARIVRWPDHDACVDGLPHPGVVLAVRTPELIRRKGDGLEAAPFPAGHGRRRPSGTGPPASGPFSWVMIVWHLRASPTLWEVQVVEIFDRITVDPKVCGGKPCVRNLRFPVSRLLGLLAAGETRESILREYPYLEPADIDAALRYAAFLAEEETVEVSRWNS